MRARRDGAAPFCGNAIAILPVSGGGWKHENRYGKIQNDKLRAKGVGKMHGIKREELKAIIEGRGCGKNVPMRYDQWIAPSVMGDQEEGVRRLLSEVPCDAAAVEFV